MIPFIDAHHHLWDLSAVRYPWLMARGVRRFFGDPTPIQRNYLVDDLLRDASGLPLVKSVHIQVGAADEDVVAETRWLQGLAEDSRGRGFPHAIVAYCDLTSEHAARIIDEHQRSPNLRGIRQIVGRREEEDRASGTDALIEHPRFAANLARVAAAGLSFDLQLVPPQALRLARVLASMPELRVAICHCGSPWDQSPSGLDAWRAGLRALAELPNVYCKISGFGMFDPHWTTERITPLVSSCLEIFGLERCMFGSNFPVEKLVTTYERVWRSFDALTTRLAVAERQRLFAGTAAHFYRI